ncbi:hypothetical protein [Candidatus Regiella insecticola]|uniref:hypothetical protein n=1 Tax=Candidatus Regiella insecticola TaxID=138073 RepID=UPI0011454632|nr:hypothetical protein [Candidatus Regiella insecticola]
MTLLFTYFIPFVFEVAFGCQGDRSMSVDRLRDSANTRSQQRSGFKGEGYINQKRINAEPQVKPPPKASSSNSCPR